MIITITHRKTPTLLGPLSVSRVTGLLPSRGVIIHASAMSESVGPVTVTIQLDQTDTAIVGRYFRSEMAGELMSSVLEDLKRERTDG